MKHNLQYLISITIFALVFMPINTCVQAEETGTTNLASLEVISSCPALLTELKATAIEEMEQKVNVNLQNAIKWGLCESPVYFDFESDDAVSADSVQSINSAGALPLAPPTSESATEYSETNVQVAGVDEADFIKNDGSYIYMLANGKLRIVDAWPPEQATEIAAFDVEGIPKKLFVHDNRAFIYSSLERIRQNNYYGNFFYFSNRDKECTYGYDCDFTGDGRELKVTVLDISDVTNPRLIREMHFSGAYLNSRRIGNAVYSVVIFPEAQITGLKYDLDDREWTNQMCQRDDQSAVEITAEITAKFEALKAENRERIQSADLSEWLPSVKDLRYNGVPPQENASPFANCDNFYQSGQKDGKSFLAIISTEINGTAPLNATTIIGKPGAVYASTSAMYVASRHSQNQVWTPWFFAGDVNIEEASTIHKFNLTNEPPASQYAGSGVVKGRVLNQFSMDEFNGFFRLATTSGHLPDPRTHSTISILEQQANELVVVGKIDEIAPTEDIRSARFMGDKGYIVTFKKTDPLFVFDLADPYQPKIAGELKIPGFSTYMHRLDANHLLTIGYDADDQGDFAWFTGIMLQIFDVTDMTKPALTHKEVIGSRGSTSEAATNHLAFNYFGSKGLLAIPMTICEKDKYSDYGGRYGDLMTFSGLLVYKVNADDGFKLVGGVPHIAPESQDNYRRACSNWWTQSNSYVKRSIFMDDYVFSITEDTIKANRMSALGTDVSVVYFADKPECDAFHVDLCAAPPDCQDTNGNWNADSCVLPLYSPRRSSHSSNICIASFDPASGDFKVPCINVAASQYSADMFISSLLPMQLMLNSDIEPATIRFATQNCEVVYEPAVDTVRIPCINNLGDTRLYWADFNVVANTPWTVELTDFGAVQ